jgi:predicted outer membrane protein
MRRLFAGVLVTLSVLLFSPGWAAASPALGDGAPVAPNNNGDLPPGWRNAEGGPIGPADIALLEQVRRADLWEGEGAAVMGMQKGTTQRIKDVGKALNQQHAVLETALKKVAEKLQVTLPTQPNADQQSWLGEMSAATGPAFDVVWVDRLRAAHGKIYSLIATVRANTRNSLVRDFATAGNNAVSIHMALLESTGLVKFNELPTPNAPTTAAAAKGVFSQGNGDGVPGFVWLVLGLGVLGCLAAVVQLVRTR